jgi:exodeoxyribonuclease V gamma subunit
VLYFYQSNQLDILTQLLGPLIKNRPPADPFAREQILVQSPGMAQWLKLELAQQLGIVANVDFPLPASFIWQMFHKVLGDVPEQSPFNKEAMAWRLLRLLPTKLNEPEFAVLGHYLDDDDDLGQRKLWQLCQKIADIFDQYLVYRPDWMAAWEAGDGLPEVSESQPWQPILWQDLVDDTVSQMASPYHRGNLFNDFIEKLSHSRQKPEGLPERVFVFGISALPPAYLKALEALALHIDLYLFFGNPCQVYWGDLRERVSDSDLGAGNPLLASMGKLGRDYLELLGELDKQELEHQPFASPGDADLLRLIQQDILELRDPIDPNALVSGGHQRPVALSDSSICFHLCHSPRRELEVLHDQLLAMLADDPTLNPRDIIVMVPDINAYSPYIQAVFGSAPLTQQIPFAISDRSATQESPVLLSFLELLALPQSRASASSILTLLDVPALARRFGIHPQQLPQLRQWVIEAGVRWGLDAHDMQRWSLPSGETNSWLFGLKRMLLGYAMSPRVGMVGDILPYDEVQGMAARGVGPLCDLIEALIQTQQVLQTARSAAHWQTALLELLGRFYEFDEEDASAQQQLLSLIERLALVTENSDFNGDISPQILLDYCRNRLNLERGSQRFLAGQVNFATLLPMRAIPFKVVCLLGMNDANYPRSVPALGFDLMAAHPMRLGDRSRRDDDRYLFLEALLAAQNRLYISYVARSAVDNSELEPSVLVSELRDYIAQSAYLVEQPVNNKAVEVPDMRVDVAGKKLLAALSTEHPLQPFSPAYYYPGGKLFSYNERWLPAARRQLVVGEVQRTEQPLPASDPIADLALTDLQRFARAPCAWFFQHRLKVYYPRLEEQLMESEAFSLDGLGRYRLDEQLLDAKLHGLDEPQQSRAHRASGQLPHGAFGDLWFEQRWAVLEPLSAQVRALGERNQPRRLVDLTLGEARLTGWIGAHSIKGLADYRPGRLSVKARLDVWLTHLAYHAMGYPPLPSYLLGRDEGARLQSVSEEQAHGYLSQWLEVLNQGQQAPLALPIETAWAWLAAAWDGKQCQLSDDPVVLKKAMGKAMGQFEGNQQIPGEGGDPYVSQVITDLEAQWPSIQALAELLLIPLMHHQEVFSYDDVLNEGDEKGDKEASHE